MRLRPATAADIDAMQRIRMAVRENILSNPAAITPELIREMIETRGRGWVLHEDGSDIVAFAIADQSRRNIWALFVDPAHERRGLGRRLHDTMLAWLFAQNEDTVWLSTDAGTRAERFYRAAGWREAGRLPNGEIRFERDARARSAVVDRCLSPEHPGWLELRQALWPDTPLDEHRDEMRAMFRRPTQFAAFVARGADDQALGFAEGALRGDYVDGTSTSPVAFLEGIYVVPDQRRRGVARQLVESVSRWGRELGCHEFASNALLENAESHAFHRAAGFKETERVVFYVRELD
jgi:aminoglycoside 6'-N-acetyltransferase I